MNTFRQGASAYLSVSGRDTVAVPAARALWAPLRALAAATSATWLLFCLLLVSAVSAHAANFIVKSTADTDGTTCGASDCTLRQAINAANGAAGGDAIDFDPTVFATRKTIAVPNSDLPVITTNLNIIAPAAGVIIKTTTTAQGYVFQIDAGIVFLEGLTINNAYVGVNARGGTTTLDGCTIQGSSANTTGIHNQGGTTNVRSCTISGNGNRGIFNSGGTTNVRSCTLSGNGTGINYFNGTVNVSNSIVAGNNARNVFGSINDQGFNILDGSAAQAGLQTDANGAPVLGDNGGPTPTIALVAGGAAVDKGNDTDDDTDQRGSIRPADLANVPNASGGNGADIGSFELDPPQSTPDFSVNTLDDHDDGACGITDCTLREAIQAAGADADTSAITFSVTGTIALAANLPALNQNLSISGPVGGLTVSGANAYSVFSVTGGDVTLRNFTISNGQGGSTVGAGGIAARGGTLTLSGLRVTGNTAADTSNGIPTTTTIGGGLQVRGASVTALNCTFDGNTGNGSTGINFGTPNPGGAGAANVLSGSLTLVHCTVAGNIGGRGANSGTTVGGNGGTGGISNSGGTLTIANTVVTGNTGGAGGVAIGNNCPTPPCQVGTRGNTGAANVSGTITQVGNNAIGAGTLAAIADNGGPTLTRLPGNGLVDAGDNATATSYGVTTDARGLPRPSGASVDIGAVELDTPQSGASSFVVNNPGDTDGTCGVNLCTLRQAINSANTRRGDDAITFDPTVFGTRQTISVPGGDLPAIASNLSISAPVAGVVLQSTKATNSYVLAIDGGTVTLSGLTIQTIGNPNDSTGISAFGILVSGGAVTIGGCTIQSNRNTPGVVVQGGSATLQNCTVVGNATNSSTGILNSTGTATVQSCTITGNRTGIKRDSGTVNVSNSIVAGNTTNTSGAITNSGFNILMGTAAQAGIDPGGLKDNGGKTQTIALLAGSPAIDAGNTTLTTDQRGFKRPVDVPGVANVGNGSDIGAFELDAAQSGSDFVVNQTDDHDDGSCSLADCTLREAINAANVVGGSISFNATVFAGKQTIKLGLQLPDVTETTTITGSAAGVTIDAAGNNILFSDAPMLTLRALNFINGGDESVENFSGDMLVEGCAFFNNGRSLNTRRTMTVRNTTLDGNGIGVGILKGGVATLESCTLADNKLGIGAGPGGGTVNVSNCILAGNSAGNIDPALTVGTINNKVDVATLAAAGLDPAGSKDNGGPVPTIALVAGSPAIDKGTGALTTDARGLPRPVDLAQVPNGAGNGSDIGAFEKQDASGFASGPNFVVTNIGDTDNGCTATNCSLREAIGAANANGAGTDTITFDPNVFGSAQSITLARSEIFITASVTIQGPGARLLTVDAKGASRIFNIGAGTGGNTWQTGPVGSMTTISGLSLVNANANGDGGAVVSNETLELNNCTLSGNKASSGGGAIRNSGTLTLNGCTLSGNNAIIGGAIRNNATLTLNNCTLSGNSTPNTGGAISSRGTSATLNNCTLSGNGAFSGGGIYISLGALGLSNSIVAGNTANSNPDVDGTINAGDYNLIGNSQGAIFGGNPANNITDVDAKLGQLRNNHGPTDTFALLAGSPAINAGDPNFNGTGQFDQRGPGFARVKQGRLDIGAFESELMVVANNAPTLGNGILSASLNRAFSYPLVAYDADGDALTYTKSGGTLPGGVTLNADGTLSGTPTQSGVFGFDVTVNDGRGGAATASFNLTVSNKLDGVAPVLTRSRVPMSLTREQLAALTLSGTVRDLASAGVTPSGVNRVQVQLRRNRDGYVYNGKTFAASLSPYYVATLGAGGVAEARTYSRALSFVPNASVLSPGDYSLVLVALDKVGNYAGEVIPVTIVAPSNSAPGALRVAPSISGGNS